MDFKQIVAHYPELLAALIESLGALRVEHGMKALLLELHQANVKSMHSRSRRHPFASTFHDCTRTNSIMAAVLAHI